MKKQGSSFMRRIFLLLLLASLGYAGFVAWEQKDSLMGSLDVWNNQEPAHTFELACSPETIMLKHQKELLRTPEYSFGKAYVTFSPLLLMHIKYAQEGRQTVEACSIWDLLTAEMILDTNTFETTHGFEDCINSQASEDDFRILHALSRHNGVRNSEQLAQELGMDRDCLASRLDALRKKQLIVQKLDTVTLHFQSPLLKVPPKTNLTLPVVNKVIARDGQIPCRYSKEQVQKLAKAAFGSDFAIRSTQEVFMPIVVIEVQNPDSSILKTYWNGITGKRLSWQLYSPS
jgi:hypothetical protein